MPDLHGTIIAAPTSSYLSDVHRADLRKSGLPDERIDSLVAERIFTTIREDEAVLVARRRSLPPGEYMQILCRHPDGSLSLDRARLKTPAGSGLPKYIQPKGVPAFAHCTSIPEREAFQDLTALVEGEKKAEAVRQCGIHSIGLTGVWMAFKPKSEILIDDLLHLQGRRVVILFDTDPVANPHVRAAAVKLQRVMHNDYGLNVTVHWLPPGPVVDGYPTKMGADDFVAAYGPSQFCREIEKAIERPRKLSISDFRSQLTAVRMNLELGVTYVDRSPPGSGKSHANIELVATLNEPTLIAVPSHKQAREYVKKLEEKGLESVAAFPKLTTVDASDEDSEAEDNEDDGPTCLEPSLIEEVMLYGLSPSATCCLTCGSRNACLYRPETERAEKAKIQLATHKRCDYSLARLAERKSLVILEEDSSELLASKMQSSNSRGFDQVCEAVRHVFADLPRIDGLEYYFSRLEKNAKDLRDAFDSHGYFPVPVPAFPVQLSINTQIHLWHALRTMQDPFDAADELRIAMAMTEGSLDSIAVIDAQAPPGTRSKYRELVAIRRVPSLAHAVTIVSDGHANLPLIQNRVDTIVNDLTPPGVIEAKHLKLQIPIDITMRATDARAVAALHVAIKFLPHSAQRIGVICHQRFVKSIKRCGESRIARVSNFYGVDSRGSNSWIEECDALITLGTPRRGPTAVRTRLLQMGLGDVAGIDGQWTRRGRQLDTERDKNTVGWPWNGLTVSGKIRTVFGSNYLDHRWRDAYEDLVTTELEQTGERSRSSNENGIPSIIVSTHPVKGAVLIDGDVPRLVLPAEKKAVELVATGTTIKDTAAKLGLSERAVGYYLKAALADGTVTKMAKGKYAMKGAI